MEKEVRQHLQWIKLYEETGDAGHARWLRPGYQNPEANQAAAAPEQAALHAASAAPSGKKPKKRPWPKEMSEQIVAVRRLLPTFDAPVDAAAVAACFIRARRERVEVILSSLKKLGLVSV